jgi:hypothetical protein
VPPRTLSCLNNEEIEERIDLKQLWSILKGFERKTLKIALKTGFVDGLNA